VDRNIEDAGTEVEITGLCAEHHHAASWQKHGMIADEVMVNSVRQSTDMVN
jgi:hypothetical protein